MTNKFHSQEWQVYIAVFLGLSIQLTMIQLMWSFMASRRPEELPCQHDALTVALGHLPSRSNTDKTSCKDSQLAILHHVQMKSHKDIPLYRYTPSPAALSRVAVVPARRRSIGLRLVFLSAISVRYDRFSGCAISYPYASRDRRLPPRRSSDGA
jgi:hypothetical protein